MRDLKWFRSLSIKDFTNGAVRDEIDDVFMEMARLKAIVDTIPQTADGERMPIGSKLWFRQRSGWEVEMMVVGGYFDRDECWHGVDIDKCYVSRESAEAAWRQIQEEK